MRQGYVRYGIGRNKSTSHGSEHDERACCGSEQNESVCCESGCKESGKPRIGYIDSIRGLSCVCVVILHATSISLYSGNVILDDKAAAALLLALNSLTRFAVPCFFMITGSMMLRRDMPLKKLYKHHIARLVLIFFASAIFYTAASNFKNLTDGAIGLKSIISQIFSFDSHLWFLKDLIGCYMLMPVLCLIARENTLLKYFIIIWLSLNFTAWFQMDILQNQVLVLGNFARGGGYWGYLLLGYYLHHLSDNKKNNWLIAAGVFSAAAIVLGSIIGSDQKQMVDEMWWGPLKFPVICYSAAMFLLAKRNCGKIGPIFAHLSKYSLGIYIFHPYLLNLLQSLARYPASALLCLLESGIVILIVTLLQAVSPFNWGMLSRRTFIVCAARQKPQKTRRERRD